MFKLIDRYVLREVTGPALLGLLVYTSIFVVNQFFQLADRWVKGTFTMADVGWTLAYYLPSIVVLAIPMSVLLGVLIGFSRLSADSEITALRTTGVSYFRLIVPTLALAIPAWIIATQVYLHAVPWGNTKVMDLMVLAQQRVDVNREIHPGTWVALGEPQGGREQAIFARGIDQSNPNEPWLTGVDLVIVDRVGGNATHQQARRARVERVVSGDDRGRLFKIYFEDLRSIRWKLGGDGGDVVVNQSPSGWEMLEEGRSQSFRNATPRGLDRNVRVMTLPELRSYLRELDDMARVEELKRVNPKEAQRRLASMRPLLPQVRERQVRLAKMEIQKRYALPVACLVFALVGMPLGITTRRGGRPASFAISIAVVLLWWVIYNNCETWCLAGRLSPVSAAWLADVALGVVAVHALLSQRKQQAVGLYRALRDGMLLSGGILWMLTAVLAFERHEMLAAAKAPPDLPWGLPIAGSLLVLGHVAFVRWRDPIAKRLADFTEAFRRPRSTVALEADDAAPAEDQPLIEAVPDPTPAPLTPVEERRWLRRARLEKVRGALLFGLLAMIGISVVEVFQSDRGPRDGLVEWLHSWEPVALLALAAGCVALQVLGVRIVSTLDWWIATGYARAFVLVLCALSVLYLVVHYNELGELILKREVQARTVASYFWNLAPRMIADTLPYASLVAALMTFGLMAKSNETTAVRCGGVSVWRAVMPAVLVAVALSCGAFVLHDYVLPRTNQQVDDIKRQMQGAPPLTRGNAGMRHFLMSSDGDAIYQFRSVTTREEGDVVQAQMAAPVVLRKSDGQVHDLWTAAEATWLKDHWVLRNGWHAVIDSSNRVAVTTFEMAPLQSMDRWDYFAAIRKDPDQMAFSEFSRYVEEQSVAGFPTAALKVRLHQKIAFPVATLILVLVGLPFAFTTGRRGALYGVGIALILAVLHRAAVALFVALGSAGYLPPVAAAWAPDIIFGLSGIYLLLHVRT